MTTIPSSSTTRMPVLFVPHGAGPCFFMDWEPADTWQNMAGFLRGVADTLPKPPRAIVLVSGHWLEPQFRVTGHPKPELIYDYYGFPRHTYELRYPAPGEPALAQQVAQLLAQAGQPAGVDSQRGFDHGVFIPLKLMFPDASVPVIQLSHLQSLEPMAHLQAGAALSPLRDDGVLIIGSGMSFHNMRGYGNPSFTPMSVAFDEWLTEAVESEPERRNEQLANWTQAPYARQCHPLRAEEHLLPLMVAAGAAGQSPGRKVYSEKVTETMISAFRFG